MEAKDYMLYYEQLRRVPAEAIKTIGAGRLKGMSDINPMWRIKAMTQAFGVCGIGWRYEIVSQWQETYGNETKAFTNINLFVKVDGEWSEAIPGTGGATLVEVNSKGSYVNDEAYKMSLTDALSVAMKALGVAADIYFSKDVQYGTKYDVQQPQQAQAKTQQVAQPTALTQPVLDEIGKATSKAELMTIYGKYVSLQRNSQFIAALTKRKGEVAA